MGASEKFIGRQLSARRDECFPPQEKRQPLRKSRVRNEPRHGANHCPLFWFFQFGSIRLMYVAGNLFCLNCIAAAVLALKEFGGGFLSMKSSTFRRVLGAAGVLALALPAAATTAVVGPAAATSRTLSPHTVFTPRPADAGATSRSPS